VAGAAAQRAGEGSAAWAPSAAAGRASGGFDDSSDDEGAAAPQGPGVPPQPEQTACSPRCEEPEGYSGGATDALVGLHTSLLSPDEPCGDGDDIGAAAAVMGAIPEERPASPPAPATAAAAAATPGKAAGECWRARLLNSSDPMVSPGRITLASKIKSARLAGSHRWACGARRERQEGPCAYRNRRGRVGGIVPSGPEGVGRSQQPASQFVGERILRRATQPFAPLRDARTIAPLPQPIVGRSRRTLPQAWGRQRRGAGRAAAARVRGRGCHPQLRLSPHCHGRTSAPDTRSEPQTGPGGRRCLNCVGACGSSGLCALTSVRAVRLWSCRSDQAPACLLSTSQTGTCFHRPSGLASAMAPPN
jgi:hypothetical protein